MNRLNPTTSQGTGADTHLPKRIFWTTLSIGLFAVATMVTVLIWVARQTDTTAQIHSRQLIWAQTTATMDQLDILVQDYAFWEAAYDWYIAGNDAALQANLGSGASDSDSFDIILLVDANGLPTHAYATDQDDADPALLQTAFGASYTAAIADVPVQDFETVRGFTMIEGRILAVAAARILPDDIEGIAETGFPVLVGARWLVPEDIGTSLLIRDLAFSQSETLQETQNQLPLRDLNGSTIGALVWPAPTPGTQMLWRLAPTLALLTALILAGSWIAGRSTAAQTRAYLREITNARTDHLTALINRTGLEEFAASKSFRNAIDRGEISVLYLDLNEFKTLNDAEGHDAGDMALQITADRLRAAVRPVDTIARLGGDEFVCVLRDTRPRKAAQLVASRITELTSGPIQVGPNTYFVRPSIGISTSHGTTSWETLLSEADAAMYHAKQNSLSEPVTYHAQMSRRESQHHHPKVVDLRIAH